MALKTYLDDLWDHQIRSDGRAPEELRHIHCEMGIFHPQASGSASFSIGNTKVFAAVYGPHEMRHAQKKNHNPDKMAINCEFSAACFSSNERKTSTKSDRKSIEISANLQSLVDNIIVQDTFPGSQVDVYVELIQDDGGSYAACINATTLALVDAGIPILDYAIACTATITHSVAMVDLNSFERGAGCPELTVGILSANSQIVVLEQSHLLQLLYLNEVLDVAIQGCKKIHAILEEAVRLKFNRLEQSVK